MLVVLAGMDIIVEADPGIPNGTIRVADPVAFLNQLDSQDNGGPHTGNGMSSPSLLATERHRRLSEAGKKGAIASAIVRRRNGSTGSTKGKPRLGYSKFTQDDLLKIRSALKTRDNSLSPLERAVLRSRFGLEGSKVHTLREIFNMYRPARSVPTVSLYVYATLKKIGVKKRRHRHNREKFVAPHVVEI